VRWVCATAAPWALAAGWLVSFTASAGHDFQSGISAALLTAATPALSGSLVPPSGARLGASPALPRLDPDGLVREAGLRFDLPDETEQLLMSLPPRSDLKAAVARYPAVDRTRKGDPIVTLRPTLSRRGTDLRQAGNAASRILFGANERDLASPLIAGGAEPPDLSAEPGFTPWHGPDPTMTRSATSIQSPSAAGAGSTGTSRGAITPSAGGATPAVPRAVALSSTTPAPADATPIEIAAAPVSLPFGGLSPRLDRGRSTSVVARDPAEKPNYAELINPDNLSREQRCLAEAVYFEARSEPEEGQAAVAQVVLNRMKSGLYPSSICGVVYQNRHRHLACQFTFACEGKALRVTDSESWRSASRIAKEVLEGKTYLADVGAATHYHADYVRPRWAKRLKKMDVIGRHIFYKLRPGQT
jgi:spore germination cell wall hydrolase CwlJ-like protein